MVRDTEEGKLDYSLVLDGPMFKRWAAHLTKGAKKYAPRNWMKATGETEFDRFKRSFLRHTIAFLDGDRDEDHAAAIIFNVNGMEYVRDQLNATPTPTYVRGADKDFWCQDKGPEGWYCEREIDHEGDHWFPSDEYDGEATPTWPRA